MAWPAPQQRQPSRVDDISRSGTGRASKVLKNIGIAALSIFLFISLVALGPVLVVKSKLLNPDFITSEFNRLELAALADDFISEQLSDNLPAGIGDAISRTVERLKPKLKEGIQGSIYQVYNYLQGNLENPDLAGVLRNTFINGEFIRVLIDEIDIVSLIKPVLHDLASKWVPEEMASIKDYIYPVIDETLASQEPSIREQLKNGADPLADYLLGEREGFNVTISTAPFVAEMKQRMQQEIQNATVPQLSLPEDLLQPVFDQFFYQITAQIPSSIQIDESVIGEDVPAGIRLYLSTAEENLEVLKEYISSFKFLFIGLIVMILALIAGICLFYRAVKGATRTLGTISLASGFAEIICFIYAANYIDNQVRPLVDELPLQLQLWLQQFFRNLLSPLQALGIGLILGGIVLLLVSFLYKTRYTDKI